MRHNKVKLAGLRALAMAVEAGNFTLQEMGLSMGPRHYSDHWADDVAATDDLSLAEAEQQLRMMEEADLPGPGAEHAEFDNQQRQETPFEDERASELLDRQHRKQELTDWKRFRAEYPDVLRQNSWTTYDSGLSNSRDVSLAIPTAGGCTMNIAFMSTPTSNSR